MAGFQASLGSITVDVMQDKYRSELPLFNPRVAFPFLLRLMIYIWMIFCLSGEPDNILSTSH